MNFYLSTPPPALLEARWQTRGKGRPIKSRRSKINISNLYLGDSFFRCLPFSLLFPSHRERRVNRKKSFTDKNGFLTKIGFREGTKRKEENFDSFGMNERIFLASNAIPGPERVVYFAVSQTVWPHLGRIWITIRAATLSGGSVALKLLGRNQGVGN